MFHQFRPKIRVYGNRRLGCSFKATINCLIWNDVELVGLQNCYLGFLKILKIPKNFQKFQLFSFSKFSLSESKIVKKETYNMLEGNSWWICAQNVKSISSKMTEIWHKTCQNRHFSRHFGTLPRFSKFYFLTDFDASKSVLGSFFAFFAKIWPKNMYRTSK